MPPKFRPLMSGKIFPNWATALLVLVAVALEAPTARADIADSVYADAKDVIEELLTAEVSHAVAPGIACLSGRRRGNASDETAVKIETKRTNTFSKDEVLRTEYVELEAARHFPRTLQHVYNQQYGTLRGTIREESAALAGYLTYRALHAAAESVRLVPGARVTPKAGKERLLQTILDQTCKAVDARTLDTQEAPPAPAAAPAPAPAPQTEIFFKPLGESQLASCLDNARHNFSDGIYGRVASYPLDESCGPKSADESTFECQVGFAVRASLLGQMTGAEDYLVKASVALLVEVVASLEPALGRVKLRQQLLLTLREAITANAWTPALTANLQSFAATPAAQALLAKAEDLHAAWRASIEIASGKLDVATFLNVIAASGGPFDAICNGSAAPACELLRMVGSLRSRSADGDLFTIIRDIKPIVSFAGRGQYGEVAQIAVRYLFQRAKADGAGKAEIDVYRRFAETVVMYVLDVTDDKVPSEATRLAFRSAAVEMIQHLGQGGGLRRRAWGASAFFRLPLILPDLSLRVSYSASYLNASGDAARIVPSANWITLRFPLRRSEMSYVGLQIAAFDPLAPLSELALRKTEGVEYKALDKLAWNFITPRVDVMLGSPALSEHFALAAGVSLRIVAPIREQVAAGSAVEPATTPADKVYRYQSIADTKGSLFQGDSLLPRFLEFGFAAKYVL